MTRPALARIDDLTIDFTRRKIFRGKNKAISLSTLSFNTLHALVEAAPAPLTAKQLIEHAWQGSVVSDDTVTQRIRLLCRALGDDRSEPRYIETIRNSGYRLIPLDTAGGPDGGKTWLALATMGRGNPPAARHCRHRMVHRRWRNFIAR